MYRYMYRYIHVLVGLVVTQECLVRYVYMQIRACLLWPPLWAQPQIHLSSSQRVKFELILLRASARQSKLFSISLWREIVSQNHFHAAVMWFASGPNTTREAFLHKYFIYSNALGWNVVFCRHSPCGQHKLNPAPQLFSKWLLWPVCRRRTGWRLEARGTFTVTSWASVHPPAQKPHWCFDFHINNVVIHDSFSCPTSMHGTIQGLFGLLMADEVIARLIYWINWAKQNGAEGLAMVIVAKNRSLSMEI